MWGVKRWKECDRSYVFFSFIVTKEAHFIPMYVRVLVRQVPVYFLIVIVLSLGVCE